jgi:hypothetical protein
MARTDSPRYRGSNWIRKAKRAAIYERDGWACAYCGRPVGDRRNMQQASTVLSLDHLVCHANGGSNHHTNLVSCCISCNSSRGNRDWRDFAPGGAQERIEYLVSQPLDLVTGKAIIASMKGHPVEQERRA